MEYKQALQKVFDEIILPSLSEIYKPQNNFFIVAIVGMGGAGKSSVAEVLRLHNFEDIRFGDITDDVVKKACGLSGKKFELTEDNERPAREGIRERFGMDIYAKLNIPKISEFLKKSNVIIDGLYSWEEYKTLSHYYQGRIVFLSIWSPPDVRYARLEKRKIRSRPREKSISRDYADIENIQKAGPIAMASYIIANRENTLKEQLDKKVFRFLQVMREREGFDIKQKKLGDF